jgi:polyisoprenoid-binding protein YceI
MKRHVMKLLPAAALPLLLLTPPAAIALAATKPSPHWTVDPARSSLGFSGTQTGSHFDGQFSRYKAAVTFDPDHPETSRIVVDVDLGSATTGDKQRDIALPGKDWFDVAHFPTARFVSTSIRRRGGNAYVATGNLTLRGVTRPILLPFTLTIDGDSARATGRAQLVRNAFGVGQGAWSSGQWVALEVGVDINIVAKRVR